VFYKELGTSDGLLECDVNGLDVYGELLTCRDQLCQLQPKKGVKHLQLNQHPMSFYGILIMTFLHF